VWYCWQCKKLYYDDSVVFLVAATFMILVVLGDVAQADVGDYL
jgi:hypothetical protein